MARKVKLDILDGLPEDRANAETEPVSLPEETAADSQIAQKRSYKLWILPGMIVMGLCLIAGGAFFVWTMMGQHDTASTANRLPLAVSALPPNMANLDAFVIDCRQQGGEFRIVTFAVTVEFKNPVNGDAIRDQVDLREAIYDLSRKKALASLVAPEQRGAFKKEIAAEVEKRLGAGVVKGVYFTKFCIL
jgi:flagellar basal body-associated protein FliL